MIHAIILSKDRAAQLRLLLQSIERNCPNLFKFISVLYKASNDDFNAGYELVKEEFVNVTWVKENDYYKDVMNLTSFPSKYTCFMTDDDIIYRRVPCTAADIDENMSSMKYDVNKPLCLSLRLGLNTYMQDQYIGQVAIAPNPLYNDGKFLAWDWSKVPSYTNFGYPFSVDGHIFDTKIMYKLLSELKFNNPNQQEVAMSTKFNEYASEPISKILMLAFTTSVLINTPLNRVQEVCLNRSGEKFGITTEELNRRFLSGSILSLGDIDFSNIVGCHQELSMTWKNKNEE